jgi:nitroreductase
MSSGTPPAESARDLFAAPHKATTQRLTALVGVIAELARDLIYCKLRSTTEFSDRIAAAQHECRTAVGSTTAEGTVLAGAQPWRGETFMQRQRVIIACGSAAAISALGYRAWDRGVFAGATGPACTPWDEWRGSDQDGNRRPLRGAILAASPHNTQPWLFEISGDAIAVYADRARHLGSFDPFRREMHLGLGCAIENFVCAARAFGLATDVQPADGRLELSPSRQPVLAAQIVVAAGQPSRDPFFDLIPRRHTNRGPYRDEPIPPKRLQRLIDLVSSPMVRLVLLVDDGARREFGALIVQSTEQIVADREMSMDSFRWIRTGRRDVLVHRDGVTIDTSGTSRLMTVAAKMLPDLSATRIDRIWVDTTRDVHTATASVFGMILIPDRLNMAQSIAAGRAWQRLHLAATAEGIAAQPLNQPVEMIDRHHMLGRPDEFGPSLVKLGGATGWEPTFVFRLGYAVREAPRSPRRPLADVVTGPPPASVSR